MKKLILERLKPNPTLEDANKVLDLARGRGYTEMVAIGGGSTIDVAKYVKAELGIPLTAIPTTTGTGAEVTKFVVLSDNGKRISLEDDKYIPEEYVLDAERVRSLPNHLLVWTALDALAQSFDSYCHRKQTKRARHFSMASIQLIKNNLQNAYENPNNMRAKFQLLLAANLSGKAINITRTSICHAMSYPLTEKYGIHHGLACGIGLLYFPSLVKYSPVKVDFVRSIFEMAGISPAEVMKDVDIEALAHETLNHKKADDFKSIMCEVSLIRELKEICR